MTHYHDEDENELRGVVMNAPLPDLEPCPHCGSKAWLRDSAAGRSRIECDECQTGQMHFADHAAAVAAWNRRAARSAPEAGKAVVKEANDADR